MILDEFFGRVYIITMDPANDRTTRTINELRRLKLSEKPILWRGIDGDEMFPPSWWSAGGPAWGCMLSHLRVLQDIWMSGAPHGVILEDDCVWQASAVRMLREVMKECQDWGQFYLGGQHGGKPEPWIGSVKACRPHSIHRTHAYVVKRWVIPHLVQHILDPKNYGDGHHVDHCFQRGHQDRKWSIAAPTLWIAGQGANISQINCREHNTQWWHYGWDEAQKQLPLVLLDGKNVPEKYHPFLHFGWSIEKDGIYDKGIKKNKGCPNGTFNVLKQIATEAYEMQRWPATHVIDAEHLKVLQEVWPRACVLKDVKFSKNWFTKHPVFHPWMNPDV